MKALILFKDVSMRRRRAGCVGFTLIELMIVVAVMGILAAIAYPSYMDSVRKSRRADATSALLNLAARQERFYTEHNSYTNDLSYTACSGLNYSTASPVKTPDGHYTITVTVTPNGAPVFNAACRPTTPATSFTISSTPVAGDDQTHDTKCATFTLTSTGVKGAKDSSNTDSTADCWRR